MANPYERAFAAFSTAQLAISLAMLVVDGSWWGWLLIIPVAIWLYRRWGRPFTDCF